MNDSAISDQRVSTIPVPSTFVDEQAVEETNESVTRYVVVEINHNHYGMSTETTVELMSATTTQITRVPHSPKYISGVINHRGTIIPVIDMRSLLGFEPMGTEADALGELFARFKQDHAKWLSDLQDAVQLDKEFTGVTDLSGCAFGSWYQSVLEGSTTIGELTKNNPILKTLIEQLEVSYRKIHSIANEVQSLKKQNKAEKAVDIINQTRSTDLPAMCDLFDQVHHAIASKLKSMLVITEVGTRKAAVSVDGVSFVTDCKDDSIEPLPDTAANSEFLTGLVHQPDGSYILITDLEHIYRLTCQDE